MKVSSNFKKLSQERKEEIRDIAISMNNVVSDYYFGSKFALSLHQKLSKAYSFFQKYYKTNLTEEEKSVFYLYVLFPNDNLFMNMIEKYENDYEKLSSIYCVSENIIKLRYHLQKNIMRQREINEIKEKKKVMN